MFTEHKIIYLVARTQSCEKNVLIITLQKENKVRKILEYESSPFLRVSARTIVEQTREAFA